MHKLISNVHNKIKIKILYYNNKLFNNIKNKINNKS